MDKQVSPVTIERLAHYSPEDTTAIDQLLAQLSDRFKDHTISATFLDEIIASPYHDILVARDPTGTIIGCATLSITFGAGAGRNAWLDDFVTDSSAQGAGVGSHIWEEMLAWAKEHGAENLKFTSSSKHQAAHDFYLKRGAVIRDTNFFKKTLKSR